MHTGVEKAHACTARAPGPPPGGRDGAGEEEGGALNDRLRPSNAPDSAHGGPATPRTETPARRAQSRSTASAVRAEGGGQPLAAGTWGREASEPRNVLWAGDGDEARTGGGSPVAARESGAERVRETRAGTRHDGQRGALGVRGTRGDGGGARRAAEVRVEKTRAALWSSARARASRGGGPMRAAAPSAGDGLDRKKLLARVRRLGDELRESKARKEAETRAVLAALRAEQEDMTARIRRLREDAEANAEELAVTQARRAQVQARIADLERKLDPAHELDVLNEQLDRTKREFEEARARRRKEFKETAVRTFHARTRALTTHAKHPDRWHQEQPEATLIMRPFVPLGESDPSLLKIPWHRDDFRPTVAFKAVPEGGDFGYVPPPRRLRITGPIDPFEDVMTALVRLAAAESADPPAVRVAARKRLPAEAVRHPHPWRAADTVNREFHRFAYARPPTAHEAKLAAMRVRPDRLSYNPTKDGKPEWRPSDSVARPFSVTERDDEWLAREAARREAEHYKQFEAGAGAGGRGGGGEDGEDGGDGEDAFERGSEAGDDSASVGGRARGRPVRLPALPGINDSRPLPASLSAGLSPRSASMLRKGRAPGGVPRAALVALDKVRGPSELTRALEQTYARP